MEKRNAWKKLEEYVKGKKKKVEIPLEVKARQLKDYRTRKRIGQKKTNDNAANRKKTFSDFSEL